MEDELDDTITVPRLPFRPSVPAPGHDVTDTFVRDRQPPALIEPQLNPPFDEPDGIELTADIPVGPPTQPWVPHQQPEVGIAPKYFRFRIGKTIVWLDAVCYVGRRPSSPRIVYGQMPRLVRVASPGQEVSSTHVEVRQLGASVVLTDMRSTNGSTVFPPGGAPRKLRQGESVVVMPGTLVDIGDGNVMEILPLESSSQADTGSTPAGSGFPSPENRHQ